MKKSKYIEYPEKLGYSKNIKNILEYTINNDTYQHVQLQDNTWDVLMLTPIGYVKIVNCKTLTECALCYTDWS